MSTAIAENPLHQQGVRAAYDRRTGLLLLTVEEAASRGLWTVAEGAAAHGRSVNFFLASAQAAGLEDCDRAGGRLRFYRREVFDAVLAFRAEHPTAQRDAREARRRRKAATAESDLDPALLSTRTPTAGQPYVWRDARRWPPRRVPSGIRRPA